MPSRGCVRENPQPVAGYVITPKATARALVLIRVAHPGRLDYRINTVTYSSNGGDHVQTIKLGIKLRAVAHGKPHALASFERKCLSLTTSLPTGAD